MASISKMKLADRVIEEIKRMIAEGELSQGDKLPNQHEFAAQLGVSRTVLREALHTLSILGVVEQRPKIGTVLVSSAPLIYTDHLNAPLIDDHQATVELFDARRVVEGGAAEMAARFASEAQIRQMERLIRQMARLLERGDVKGYTEKNTAFHLLIAEASGNRFMGHLLVTIRGFMERWARESLTALPDLFQASLQSHREIHQAIKARDAAQAGRAMRQHMNDFKSSVEQYYRQMNGAGAGGAKKASA